jgi:N-acetyl sugar amidotransferase
MNLPAMRRVCTFCVMDDSNPGVVFDAAGQCDCCRDALARMPHEWWPGPEGQVRMDTMVRTLKEAGRGKRYDAMIGLSGGIDSAYLAHIAVRRLGLRVLAVHVDGGWNSEPAVRNIESIVRALDIDLHTHVIEWHEMKDLQVALLKASVLNQDMPQDHAFFATLYRTAARFGLRHFLSGVNFSSENVVPRWGFPSMDGKHIKALHSRFGTVPLASYPIMPLTEFLWLTRVRKVLTVHRPLNYLGYDKEAAGLELTQLYGWRDYGGKHCESRFTKFYQELYLPRKFGFDKRRLHLSSLIVSGQLTRDAALEELAQPIASPDQARRDLKFVAKKLGLSVDELNRMIDSPAVNHLAYPNQMALHRHLTSLKGLLRRSSGAAPSHA